MGLPEEVTVCVNDYVIIDDAGKEKKFQIKRQSVEPWFCLQEVLS